MARRRHLIAYDIADPKRLRRVCNIMEGYGERLQYSVFLCDLDAMELANWELDIEPVLKWTEDSIVVIDLGLPGKTSIRTLGVPRRLPSSGPVII